MSKKAVLVLEDGSKYEGYTFGAETTTYGEVVFDTAMAGYHEMLTDPSFAGQIVVPTYPLVGNYGVNKLDFESNQIQVRGFVVREYCEIPSHWQPNISLHDYLLASSIPGLSGIDTRALTRRIRSSGVMMGILTSELTIEQATQELKKLPAYGLVDYVKEVSTTSPYSWESSQGKNKQNRYHIIAVDMGLKFNIVRLLNQLGCVVTIMPATTTAIDVLNLNPDGIVLSPGPGDPALLDHLIQIVKEIVYTKPVMGICLGHQLIAHAFGATTFKLKFGHRGGNHPVRELSTGRIHITTQNHGYAVNDASLKNGLYVSHINSNDGTVEGLCHRDLPILSIQFHAEGAPGPQDNIYLFNKFIQMVKDSRSRSVESI